MGIVVGVDEAGRGPLIGDMFVAVVGIDSSRMGAVAAVGARDSKSLDRDRRESVFQKLLEVLDVVVVVRASPSEIDSKNLNLLFIEKVCQGLRKVVKMGFSIEKIYVDACGDPARIRNSLTRCITGCEIVAEHGADAKYPIVGAASIVAKVLRDWHIDQLKSVYGDFGSGYPSDRRTIEWLKQWYQKHREIPPIVRRSWSTIERVLGIRSVSSKTKTLLEYIRR